MFTVNVTGQDHMVQRQPFPFPVKGNPLFSLNLGCDSRVAVIFKWSCSMLQDHHGVVGLVRRRLLNTFSQEIGPMFRVGLKPNWIRLSSNSN